MPKMVGLSGKPLRMIRAGEALQIRHRDENPRTDATEGELLLGQKVVYGSAADREHLGGFFSADE